MNERHWHRAERFFVIFHDFLHLIDEVIEGRQNSILTDRMESDVHVCAEFLRENGVELFAILVVVQSITEDSADVD